MWEHVQELSTEKKRLAGHTLVGLSFLYLAAALPRNYFVDSAAAGYFLILADSFFRQTDACRRATNFRVSSLLFLFTVVVLPIAESFESAVCPVTMDGVFRAADLRLGLDGFLLSRFCLAHAWAYDLTVGVYTTLPLVMATGWVVSRSSDYLRAALGSGLAAIPCYLLFPAVGPQYAFAGWPASAARIETLVGAHPRNCMPSMHFAWAALAAINVRGRWRALFVVYSVMMGFAAVASGEHYCIDVLAAIPFLSIIQLAVRRFGRIDGQNGSR